MDRIERIAHAITADYSSKAWCGNPVFWTPSHLRECFKSDIFTCDTPSDASNDLTFTLVENSAESLSLDDAYDTSQYMRRIVDLCEDTLQTKVYRLACRLGLSIEQESTVADVFSDGVLDLSRIGALYDNLYQRYGSNSDFTKEECDEERDMVIEELGRHMDELKQSRNIDFKVRLHFETETDEGDMLKGEEGKYSEFGLTVTAYGILDGKEKRLWSMYSLIDSHESEWKFCESLEKRLKHWFDIKFNGWANAF